MSIFTKSLFEDYFKLTQDTESARITHRWSCISLVASTLGNKVWINFGGTKIYPNMYIMLVGSAGSRKSTAIKFAAKMLNEAGYKGLAASSTSREQFFADFADQLPAEVQANIRLGLISQQEMDAQSCCYTVIADEFNDFAGANNGNMYTSLANLWDYKGVFEYRPKHGDKVAIVNPNLNILSGNTADGFTTAFPPQTLNQGLPSRTILINSLGRRKKIFWPETPNPLDKVNLVTKLKTISKLQGELEVTQGAMQILKSIYENWVGIPDSRFISYGSRRYQQLLKLCIVMASSVNHLLITKEVVLEANTILTFAERYMPDALGEHGLNRSSPAAARILDAIKYATGGVIEVADLYKIVASDVKDFKECRDLIMNLVQAGKAQATRAGITYINRNSVKSSNETLHCRFDKLWENELMIGW